ncbi:MAG: L,D-transpeptidase family protein [Paracoccus sp. (in: a-proteobacteria)]|uniref:L,D-transpeptidase family protein n=1 Tax=Paracoccus sp. TaxID=267 RepID=UPI0039E3F52B
MPELDWPELHWPELRLPRITLPEIFGPKPEAKPPATPPVAPPVAAMPLASPVERILIEKSARRMTVWQKEGTPRSFRIALGFAPEGDKGRQGDGRTPEGVFRVDRLNRNSAFHLSLGLDYPQKRHREAARKGGYDPGGDIMIHGQPKQVPDGYRVKGDWTAGCIAVSNAEIEEIFAQTALGTRVEIRP